MAQDNKWDQPPAPPPPLFAGKKEIARGGRYDDLLKSLGAKKNIPAVGAAINLNNI